MEVVLTGGSGSKPQVTWNAPKVHTPIKGFC
jgi:hypothetical protein